MNTKNTQSALVAQSGAVAAESAVAKSWDGEASIPPISASPMESSWSQKDGSQAVIGPSLLLFDPSIPKSIYVSSSRQTTGQPKPTSSGTQTGQLKADSLTQSVGACRSSGYPPNKLPEYTLPAPSTGELTKAYAKSPGVDLAATLKERGDRYGAFDGHSQIAQGIKVAMRLSPKWWALTPSHKESLEMIAHKIGRILNGDPNYADSWVDIAGYAQLIVKQLEAK